MRYGLINGDRCEANSTGQRSLCPCCGGVLISKCGILKINHWAHENLIECDSWVTNLKESFS